MRSDPWKLVKAGRRPAKVLQSWNKVNLYNLKHASIPHSSSKTFFQQKWIAKSLARTYHGEQVRESQWEKMFSRRLRSVVPMDANYLARNDGSFESAGRGSGLEGVGPRRAPLTPHMQMTFAPLERRLDVAIFRAMFASSTRQARQFVIHGSVTVNGKKMRYPGYLLNPGDLFQVDPERVMFATGAPKDPQQRRRGRKRRNRTPVEAARDETGVRQALSSAFSSTDVVEDLEAQFLQLKALADISPSKSKPTTEPSTSSQASSPTTTTTTNTSSTSSANLPESVLPTPPPHEISSAKPTSSPSTPQDPVLAAALKQAIENPTAPLDETTHPQISEEDLTVLRQALYQLHENPIDSLKPYATPWRPRDYMSAFAFIPRYLEVNQNICAAVYLRHPVARPGRSEVPSPYPDSVNGAAFVWYLRRR
ncbi:NAM9+ protein [Histoplasma capsulatum]|uniref:Small ribosomal subunit protein uS4m n=1 Tax=Ajellomyces capsulatus TaxID=5037 RepID=A0A8A1M336_AJECA|nr:NAM9+ protein [Histoplasma capsulatum]